MRRIAGFPPREGRSEGRSDFFYHDREGKLAPVFGMGTSNSGILFLIEVKSAVGTSNVFHMSHNQFALVFAESALD